MTIILTILFVFVLNLQANAYDLSDFGDFSSRSSILGGMNNTQINQEQRDVLKEKKLTPTAYCLIEQIKRKKIDNVKLLLDSKVNPNTSYMSDYPIYIAAKVNSLEIVELLYSYGAKLDRGFFSELFEAVKNKNEKMAYFLLEKGAKVNYSDSVTCNTILYTALKNKMYDIAKILIKKGAYADNKSIVYIKKKKLYDLIENN